MVFPNPELTKLHFVLFIKEFTKRFNKVTVCATLLDAVPELDPDSATILPLPDDAPAEIPRVVLKGSGYECQVGLQRTALVYSAEDAGIIKEFLPEFLNKGKDLSKIIIEELGFVVSRIGIVIEGIVGEANPIEFLNRYYLKNDLSLDNEVELSLLYHPVLNGLLFNNWLRLYHRGNKLTFLVDYNTVEQNEEELELPIIEIVIRSVQDDLFKNGGYLSAANEND